MIVFNTDSNTKEEQNKISMNFYAAKMYVGFPALRGFFLFLKTEIDGNLALDMTVILKNSVENTNSTLHPNQPTEV